MSGRTLLDVLEAVREDGTACTDLVLDPVLVPVQGRAMRAFQGWRYLADTDAPADLGKAGPHVALPRGVAAGADGPVPSLVSR